jgi:hypothetical protein
MLSRSWGVVVRNGFPDHPLVIVAQVGPGGKEEVAVRLLSGSKATPVDCRRPTVFDSRLQ